MGWISKPGSGGDGAVFCVREALDFEGNLKRRIVGREYWGVCDSLGLGAEGCEALDGEDLLVEDEAELPGGLVGNGFEAG
jgi:hypothetical protein